MMLLINSVSLRAPLQLNIIFEDVLGRRRLLPFQYFRSWNVGPLAQEWAANT